MKEPIFCVNGRFVPASEASISVRDIGLLRGYGVFDYTMTYNRQPFRLQDHLQRLESSAKAIEIDLPWSKEEIAELVHRGLEKNPDGEMGIRIVVTGGESPDSLTPARPNLIILITPFKGYPKEYFTDGVKVVTFPAKREIPEAKTLNYIYAIRALKKAKREGGVEAIYIDNGLLYEGPVCSFFAVKEGRVIVPGSDVLDGITRRTVLELIKGKIPVEYRFVKVSEISSLDEAFLTSSAEEIMPIVKIDEAKIGDGKPGPITKEIMRLFREYAQMGH